jgi:hypothetical protein
MSIMRQKKSTTFYCFSPPVMVATFLIEIVAAIFVLYRYKANKASRLVVALLLCLSAFQLAEYYVCTNSSQAVMAARLGFVAITLLPVLGLHLMYTLTNNTTYKNYTRFIYGLALFISVYFLMAPQVFDSYQCTGNYVIFQIGNNLAMYYGLYYFGLLAQSILTGVYYLRSEDSNINKLAVKWFVAGYFFFIVPVAFLNVLHPNTGQAIPSILCGFAVTLAIVLVLKIAPLALKKK